MKTQLFDWALPERFRRRKPMEENELVKRLAGMDPNEGTYRTLLELVHEQFAQEVTALLHPDAGSQQARGKSDERGVNVNVSQVSGAGLVEYRRGRAAALYSLLDRIEAERERCREEAIREGKRKEQRQ